MIPAVELRLNFCCVAIRPSFDNSIQLNFAPQINFMGFFNKLFGKKEKESLDEGLQKTKDNFFSKVSKAISGKSTVDEEVLDELENPNYQQKRFTVGY